MHSAARRAEYDRTNGNGGALVPYSAQAAPHADAGGRYYDDYDLPPAAPREPPRRSASAAGYGRPPYAEPPPYAPPRGREFDMYDDFGYGDRKSKPQQQQQQRRGGGFEDELFSNPFGAFGGSGSTDLFDLGLDGGNKSQQPMSDPFSLFQGFMNGGNGRGSGNGQLSMSPESGHEDPLSQMMNALSMQGGGDRGGAQPRGAFATHRVTRRHTNRHGETTISRQERCVD